MLRTYLQEATMPHNKLLAVVLAVSTLFVFSVASAADVTMMTQDTDLLVSMVTAKDQGFKNDPETLRKTIIKGRNFSKNLLIVHRSCGTPQQCGFVIDLNNNRLIPLPHADCEYAFQVDNELLIINPTPAEYTIAGVPRKECAHRRMYTLKKGRFVKFREDTAGSGNISNENLFPMFLSSQVLQ